MTATLPCKWAIVNLKSIETDGFVFEAEFSVTATGGGRPFSTGTSITFERPDNLIPYGQLTEDLVVGWVKEELGPEAVKAWEEKASEGAVTPIVIEGFPWNPPGYDPNFNPPEDAA